MPERAKDKRNRQPRSRAIKEEAFGTAPSPSFQASPSVPHVTFCCSHAWSHGGEGCGGSGPLEQLAASLHTLEQDSRYGSIQMEDSYC